MFILCFDLVTWNEELAGQLSSRLVELASIGFGPGLGGAAHRTELVDFLFRTQHFGRTLSRLTHHHHQSTPLDAEHHCQVKWLLDLAHNWQLNLPWYSK
jgi:hypothetical protein